MKNLLIILLFMFSINIQAQNNRARNTFETKNIAVQPAYITEGDTIFELVERDDDGKLKQSYRATRSTISELAKHLEFYYDEYIRFENEYRNSTTRVREFTFYKREYNENDTLLMRENPVLFWELEHIFKTQALYMYNPNANISHFDVQVLKNGEIEFMFTFFSLDKMVEVYNILKNI